MERSELMKVYETHAAEYRLQVQLGWDRLKFFVTLNVALLAALSGFAQSRVAAAGYVAGVVASLLGAHVVRKTHEYYRNARDAFLAVERALGITEAGHGMSTTPGMAGASWTHKLRVTDAGVIVLVVLAVLDVVLAVRSFVG